MKWHLTNTKVPTRILCPVYVGSILFLCLIPNPFKYIQHNILLDISDFSWLDFLINTMGFIPMGYLLMLSFGNQKKDQRLTLFKQVIIVIVVGSFISLFIEFAQYYLIFGRKSSLFDLIANTLGILAGIAIYLFKNQTRIA